MSQETQKTLDSNLYGDTAVKGLPWHARTGAVIADDGTSNYYPGAIPLQRVNAFLDRESVTSYPAAYVMPGSDPDGLDDVTVTDNTRQVIVRDRDSHVHGVFGADSYVVHQYRETFTHALAGIVGESPADLHYSGVGVLRNGGRAYTVISTSDLHSTPQGVDYFPFITVATSNDGTLAMTVGAGSVLSVCDNTLAAALGEAVLNDTSTKIKHTKFSAARLSVVSARLLLDTQADEMDSAIESLCSKIVTDAQWSAFLDALAPVNVTDASKNIETRNENMRATLTGFWNADPRVAPWKNSAFGALQAVNTFDLWERSTRKDTTHAGRTMDEFIGGKLATRESDRAALLAKVLATV